MGWYGRGGSKLTANIFNIPRDANEKKIRETYDNEGLCHAWASSNVLRGRSSAMFFEGGIIYSFGHHYKAAKIYGDYVLMNEDTRSNTTSGHLSDIRRSVSHKTIIKVPDVDPGNSHQENIDYLENKIFDRMMGIYSMVGWHGNGDSFLEDVEQLNNYLKAFNLKGMIDVESDDIQFTAAALTQSYNIKEDKLRVIRETKEKNLKDKFAVAQSDLDWKFRVKLNEFLENKITLEELNKSKSQKVVYGQAFGRDRYRYLQASIPGHLIEAYDSKLAIINADKIKAWRNGDINHLDYNIRGSYAILRVKENVVYTSHGANVPLEHALRLLKMIERGQAKKGERVGYYNLECVSDINKEPVVITIGCHKILLSEAQEVLRPHRENLLKLVQES